MHLQWIHLSVWEVHKTNNELQRLSFVHCSDIRQWKKLNKLFLRNPKNHLSSKNTILMLNKIPGNNIRFKLILALFPAFIFSHVAFMLCYRFICRYRLAQFSRFTCFKAHESNLNCFLTPMKLCSCSLVGELAKQAAPNGKMHHSGQWDYLLRDSHDLNCMLFFPPMFRVIFHRQSGQSAKTATC